MKTVALQPRQLPLDDSWDVIVVGGGPAGCASAVAAAREGRKTMLIEAAGSLGGMGTLGLVPAWCPFSDKERIIYAGLAARVFNETKSGMPHVKADAMDWVPIDPERLKRVYDQMLTEFGVQVLFNTMLAGVEMGKDGAVDMLIVNNKAGLSAYKAKVYIDCTGDADIAAWAGAPFDKGAEIDGELQPATHCFMLTNVDEYHFHVGMPWSSRAASSPMQKILDSGRYPMILDKHFCVSHVGPGTVGFNAGHLWKVDNTDPLNTSKALMEGRRLAVSFRDALAEFSPAAFGNAFLVATGSLLGIRETRRIRGDYSLNVEDYLARRSFPDEIARNSYFIDIHHSSNEIEQEKKGSFDWDKRCAFYQPGESHGIPYRCLTPQGLRNVLVAGRSISCDRAVQGSVRVMPVCLVMGEAAGIAASHALQLPNCDVHAVNVPALRKRLKEMGAYLP